MSFLFDTLRHLLASDPASRLDALGKLAGRIWAVEPVRVSHPDLPADRAYGLAHFPKPHGTRAPRSYAITTTLGLGDRELVALTLADAREPDRDRTALLLGRVAESGRARGAVVALPEGTLGRSAHQAALIAAPWPLPPLELPEIERILGARLDLVVPITAREAAWIEAHTADAFTDTMRDQGVAPLADRAPGQVELPA